MFLKSPALFIDDRNDLNLLLFKIDILMLNNFKFANVNYSSMGITNNFVHATENFKI